jgi:DNA-binding CsgD family transcriptional regulator
MPTKDMARMQNLSVRGIEAARYRLRKKLDIPDGKSLVDFMIEFK